MASRKSQRSVLNASRARYRSALPIQENGVAFFGGHASSGESARGFEGAVHCCQANSWEGVLKWVFALKETDEGDASSA